MVNRKREIVIGIVLIGFIVALFLISQPKDTLYEAYQLETNDIGAMIEQLENNDYQGALSASVSHQVVSIQTEDELYTFDLPESMFYISFAPYINTTHDCFTHSLTGCQGELMNQDMDIKIYDEENILIETLTLNTGDDGFIGLFLEQGQDYRVVVDYNQMTTEFSTYPTQTCYTAARLS